MKEQAVELNSADSLKRKVEFLRHAEVYPETNVVNALETHMSWVFLTDHYVYKLKKPVSYDFLNFKSLEARYRYCMEELAINQSLAHDIYLGIVPLTVLDGSFELNGKGKVVDWLVKMRRLPEEQLLSNAIKAGSIHYEWVQRAAEMLVDFYLASSPVNIDFQHYRQQLINDIESNTAALLRSEFKLSQATVIGIETDLLHFIVKYPDVFDARIVDGKIVDGHGDLRPEHIFLGSRPAIIDRIEFNSKLRVIDVAEELSFLALECEMLGSTVVGQLFFNVYKWMSQDKIPEVLVFFFKSKRALLRAKLSAYHLLEKKYRGNEALWKGRCQAYLEAAGEYGKLTA